MNIFNYNYDINIPEGKVLKILDSEGASLWKRPLVILPHEYIQVEYIQMTGTQYTTYRQPFADVSELQFAFSLDNLSSTMNFTGAYNNTLEAYLNTIFQQDNQTLYCFSMENNNGCAFANIITENTKYNLTIQANAITSTQTATLTQQETNMTETKTSQMNIITNKELSQFGIGLNGYIITDSTNPNFNNGLIGKIYSYKHIANETVVRNFVPCYRKADLVPGFFEIVHGEFYSSQGTEPFIAGPNVSTDIIDYIGYFDNTRISSSYQGPITERGYVTTGLIDRNKFTSPTTFITSGVNFMVNGAYLVYYDTQGNYSGVSNFLEYSEGGETSRGYKLMPDADGNLMIITPTNTTSPRYFRLGGGLGLGANLNIIANYGIPGNLVETSTADPGGVDIFNKFGYSDTLRWSSSGQGLTNENSNSRVTGWIPYTKGTLTVKNMGVNNSNSYVNGIYLVFYHKDGTVQTTYTGRQNDDIYTCVLDSDTITYFRVSGVHNRDNGTLIADPIVTIT